jgi:predicted helicase
MHDLDEAGFGDMYAQTIAYGLLSARIADPKSRTADDLTAHMKTNPFLKELMQTFLHVGGRKGKAGGPGIDFDELGVSEVVELLDDANMEAVIRDFGDKKRDEDPVMHFYESFLHEYNKQLKIQRGVFYTPLPVVSYIVRSVHELLETEFGLADGLADTTTWGEMLKKHPGLKLPQLMGEAGEKLTISPDEPFVQILDPATGTATFLVEVINVIYVTLKAKWKKQRLTEAQQVKAWNDYVPKHLLPRLHAYELMMAPYAIAHMKIGLKLAETGYDFGSEERARIYLTNALEPWHKQLQLPEVGTLAHEAAAVNEIKRNKRFTVVIGNPPYSGHSANTGDWISNVMRGYYFVDGVPLGERNPKWLQDDYVKFMRLGQVTLDESGVGVLGYITNHGYFDNPTFRGMRKSLMTSFSAIRLYDLHGNSKKNEVRPGGGPDENVFDIQQGVGIGLLAKGFGRINSSAISHADLWGLRSDKYAHLSGSQQVSMGFRPVSPAPPFYLFVLQNENIRSEYNHYPSLTDAMPISSVGFVTSRDEFVMAFDKKVLIERFGEFCDRRISDKLIQERYPVGRLALPTARAKFASRADWQSTIVACQYRPFDQRFICYAEELLERPRLSVMSHLVGGRNIALLSARSNKSAAMDHFYCSKFITETKCSESSTQSYVFPLYVLSGDGDLIDGKERRVNFSGQFLQTFTKLLGLSGDWRLTPEVIFYYAYAVFHSPGYRGRYAEFLKIDFPRLPLTGNLELFHALAKLGGELIALHLLESPKLDKPNTEFIGRRNPEVEKASWSKKTVWLDKAQTIGFKGVAEDVWNFHIGGYQVCEKWLKARKGCMLSKDDVAHYQKIIVALSETIRLMAEIDDLIDKHGGWPGAFKAS